MNKQQSSAHGGHTRDKPVMAEMAGIQSALQVSDKSLAGDPIQLTYRLLNAETGLPLQDIIPSHERMLHTVVVSHDLAEFVHAHPVVGPDPGSYVVELNLCAPGTYRAFTEFERESGPQVLVRHEFDVGGTSREANQGEPGGMVRRTSSYAVTLSHEGSLLVGRPIRFVLEIRDEATGLAARDLKPYLGAAAHVIVISGESYQFNHHHGETVCRSESGADQEKEGVGPFIGFEHIFEEVGLHRIWAQFSGADGETQTTAWTVVATEAEDEPHAPGHRPPQSAPLAASDANSGGHRANGGESASWQQR